MRFNMTDARKRLPELIKAVERGEPVTICRRGVPVVDLVRATKARPQETAEVWNASRQDQSARSELVETDDGRRSGSLSRGTLLSCKVGLPSSREHLDSAPAFAGKSARATLSFSTSA